MRGRTDLSDPTDPAPPLKMSRPVLVVIVADLWWGLSAIYWNELDTVDPIDQLGWRVVLGLVMLGMIWGYRRRLPLRRVTARHVAYGTAAGACVFVNWTFFLWAVANEQALEAALGYFLMPIISTVLAITVLGERPRRLQTSAVLVAAVGMIWMFVRQGGVPWVAVVLGSTFAAYGLLRKQGPWEAVEGLTFEMALAAPIGAVLLLVRSGAGESVAGDGSAVTLALISLTGVVTVVPLILFAYAARRAPLLVVGLLQYVVPITQFLVGWLVLDESVTTGRLLGFALIWAALVLVIADQIRSQRPVDRLAPGLDQGRVRA